MEHLMNNFKVELIYISENQSVFSKKFPFENNECIRDLIEKSGILNIFPEINWNSHGVGIYGKSCTLDTKIKPDDRIEIYRPLRIDPKTQRRTKAKSAIASASHLKKRAHS